MTNRSTKLWTIPWMAGARDRASNFSGREAFFSPPSSFPQRMWRTQRETSKKIFILSKVQRQLSQQNEIVPNCRNSDKMHTDSFFTNVSMNLKTFWSLPYSRRYQYIELLSCSAFSPILQTTGSLPSYFQSSFQVTSKKTQQPIMFLEGPREYRWGQFTLSFTKHKWSVRKETWINIKQESKDIEEQ